ncbi:MAG: dihydroorotate dehydrogenase [Spirochaetes bacterium]|nr:dihydroorotate dehydrogenase [Spirochaetota bacterium]
MNLSVSIGTLHLKNPITVASGTAGYGQELSQFVDIGALGAIFTKGLSLKPRAGNPGPRIAETPSGMLNSIGLENVGIEAFLSHKLPYLLKANATVIPNIAGHSIDENVELAKILSHTDGIAAIELNVSCPNVKEGGIAFGQDISIFSHLLEKVRTVTRGILIVKLSPNVTDITQFAKAAKDIGADAVSAVNTFVGMKIDTTTGKPYFANTFAGLSGPAIKPIALRMVYQIVQRVDIPVIGIGGIFTLEDALEFLMAGAKAIQIGTANLVNPDTSAIILKKLKEYLQQHSISDINNLIGIAHRKE